MLFPLVRFKIQDKSMEPTLKSGDYTIVNKLAYVLGNPSEGDIIVFKHPKVKDKFLIKRIAGVSGKKYFAVGDNKNHSIDSRHFGPIEKNLIVGKLLMHIKKI